ncbi:PfkB family carbohydrate kinase [Pseudonocardia sp. TRM90224]|uniref:PfkB family carbohydrate kinase n=1 Tax=Pseudonocardia sp. TRM90224 TaxID=2812678 RepID=UPI001E3E386A|nr:PfkB family carbohydrate kinase [Pseudonocardia sp. TRM90224]
MTGRLIHTGQVVLDLVMRVPAMPPVGGDVFATATVLTPGGGFNVMAAAARAGARVTYAGGHGEGHFGDTARAGLAAEGIEVALPPTPGQDTGICVVLVDATGERTFVTGSGAEQGVPASALVGLTATTADIVYVTGYSLLDTRRAHRLLGWVDAQRGPIVLVDPGPLAAEIDTRVWQRVLDRADVLSANARETAALGGPAALAAALHKGGSVVVRDGADGCTILTARGADRVPGFPVDPVDTNGAGDAHCGVLAAELLRGADLRTAARRANAAASIAVTRYGPATAPSRDEVDALLTST